MLICAVLDDSVRTARSEFIGRLPVTAKSNDIKHVGSAMVIFEPRRIIPLFVVSRPVLKKNRKKNTLLSMLESTRR